MGCGGSKQDVATGNTVTRKQSEEMKSKTITAVTETEDASFMAEKEACDKIDGLDSEKPLTVVKDITVNTEAKGEGVLENGGEIEVGEPGKLIGRDSPDRFFSSRKEESVEMVAKEEGSEVSSKIEEGGETVEPVNSEAGAAINGGESVDSMPAKQEIGDGEKALVKEEKVKEEEVKANDNEIIVELKEPVLIEEAKTDASLGDEKNPSVEGATEEPSSKDSTTN